MKLLIVLSILSTPLISFAQSNNNLNLLHRNLLQIDEFKLLKTEKNEYFHEDKIANSVFVNECFESGDFYVSSAGTILVSNINTPLLFDTIIISSPKYGGSIGIISEENTLLNPKRDSVFYYSENGWEYYGHSSTFNDLVHCGGGNKTVFYMGGNLWHLNGSDQPQLIYANIKYTCADLVVDSLERAWVLTGTTWPISDTLRVIDSTGYQICKFPFREPLNTINAYGMIMYQNKIWLGMGRFNPLYKGKLLPLEIINNEVVAGSPVDFPDMNFLDLESCEVGLPEFNCLMTSTNELIQNNNSFNIFPNPSHDVINVTSDIILNKVEILNLTGNSLIEIVPEDKRAQINIERLPQGIYYILLRMDDHMEIKKLIKIE